jgi:hypothetical protein
LPRRHQARAPCWCARWRGIKERNGYSAGQFRLGPDFTVPIDPALGHH